MIVGAALEVGWGLGVVVIVVVIVAAIVILRVIRRDDAVRVARVGLFFERDRFEKPPPEAYDFEDAPTDELPPPG